jgi:hypothetical protein
MTEQPSREALVRALATAEAELARIALLADARLNEADPDQTLVSVMALTRIGGILAAAGYALIGLLPDDQVGPSADPYPAARRPHIPAPRDPGFPSF